MKNIFIAGDLHISSDSLEECKLILQEQKELIKKYNVDTYISTGDNFDSIKPNSIELDLFANFLKAINIPAIIIAAQSHESETPENSILNHFEILNNNIKIVKEYSDDYKLFIGHFGLKESKLNKFGATHSAKEFLKYKWVILGHFHSFEKISGNCIQLGSSRWIDFAEAQDKQKVVLLIENYDTEHPKCSFLTLKSPISMISLELDKKSSNLPQNSPLEPLSSEQGKDMENSKSSISQAQNPSNKTEIKALCEKLNSLPEKTKVRIIFKDYSLWREFLPFYQKYKDKFVLFKDKKDFNIISEITPNNVKNETLKESLIKWLEQNKIEEKIKQILLEEINNGS